jgi:hypothetical protein
LPGLARPHVFRSRACASARNSSINFEQAYPHRLKCGGPISKSSSSPNAARRLLPYTSEVEASKTGVPCALAASSMACVSRKFVSMVARPACITNSTPTAAAR